MHINWDVEEKENKKMQPQWRKTASQNANHVANAFQLRPTLRTMNALIRITNVIYAVESSKRDRLNRKRSIARHNMLFHSGSKTIFCKDCYRKFMRTDELVEHLPKCPRKRKLKQNPSYETLRTSTNKQYLIMEHQICWIWFESKYIAAFVLPVSITFELHHENQNKIKWKKVFQLHCFL